jgi:ribonucleoside-diphosphate reductase alpha chain
MEWHQKISEEQFKKKYMIQPGDTSPEVVLDQVAKEISNAEKGSRKKKEWYSKFKYILETGYFSPGGRTVANARENTNTPYYVNCYATEIPDTLQGIYKTLEKDSIINKSGGGNGINFTPLRPEGATLSKGGHSSGPVSFMELFDTSGKIILTGGNRRAARIFLLDVSHPDIRQFITAKRGEENKKLTHANLSVVITDDFMKAVKKGKNWDLTYNGEVYETVKARELYDLIVENAFYHNEPGVFFIDRVNRDNIGDYAYWIDAVNPCGEIPLTSKGGACNLGSVFLHKFVVNPFSSRAYFDSETFRVVVAIAVRFLDNVVSKTKYPLPEIENMQRTYRKLGLGYSGLGDALAMLGIPYGSEKAVTYTEAITKTLKETSYLTSSELAQEKGKFPGYVKKHVTNHNFIKDMPAYIQNKIKRYGLRNVGLNAIAPTGTISLTLGQNCSSGIEPIFSLEYERTIRTGNKEETEKEHVYDYGWLLYTSMKVKEGATEIEVPDYFTTINDVCPYDAVEMQAAAQRHIDSSISKTANLPSGYDKESYNQLFFKAWEKGLKGFTSFNPDGSIRGILNTESSASDMRPEHITRNSAPKRPKELECDIYDIRIKGEKHIALVGLLNGTVYEIFVTSDIENKIDTNKHSKGKIVKVTKGRYDLYLDDSIAVKDIGKVFDTTYASLSRLLSLALRHGTPLEHVVQQLAKDSNFIGFDKTVARVLKKYIKDGEVVTTSDKCEDCGADLFFQEGCKVCSQCGWSKCG